MGKVELSAEDALAHARSHLEKGNALEAIKIAQLVVDEFSNNVGALNFIGVCYLRLNKWQDAKKWFEISVKYAPDNAGLWGNIGFVHLALNEFEDAISAYERAYEIDGENDIYLRQKIQTLLQIQNYTEANQLIDQMLDKNSEDVDALLLRHRLALSIGRFPVCFKTLETIKTIKPDMQRVVDLEICHVYIEANYPGRARDILDKLLREDPNDKRALWLYGDMLQQSGLSERALIYFEKAISGLQLDVSTKMQLASTLLDLGQKDQARTLVLEVLDEAPKNVSAYPLLAMIEPNGLSDNHLLMLDDLEKSVPEICKQEISFARATSLDGRKDYIKAMRYYKIANHDYRIVLEKQNRGYYPKKVERKFQQMKLGCHAEILEKSTAFGHESTLPVFIAGMPRSGTTLTERILGAHSRVAGVGELMDIPQLAMVISKLSASKKPFPDCLEDFDLSLLKKLGEAYVNRLHDWEPDAEMVVNKLPGNFMYLGLIRMMFPNAKIIHCVRDPRDTMISCFVQRFGPGLSFSYDLNHLAHQYGMYDNIMQHWEGIMGNGIYHSLYSDLVTAPEIAVKSLLDACGLEFEDQCLDFYKSDKAVRTASRLQVRQPIYTSSLERWRRYEGEIDEIQHIELPKRYKSIL
jgi:tetratricopeptide (TPR) repeat protein